MARTKRTEAIYGLAHDLHDNKVIRVSRIIIQNPGCNVHDT
jgi:hypothetical protein